MEFLTSESTAKLKERIVAQYLGTEDGREKLASSMLTPLKTRIGYWRVRFSTESDILGAQMDWKFEHHKQECGGDDDALVIWDRLLSSGSSRELKKPVFQELSNLVDELSDVMSEVKRRSDQQLNIVRPLSCLGCR